MLHFCFFINSVTLEHWINIYWTRLLNIDSPWQLAALQYSIVETYEIVKISTDSIKPSVFVLYCKVHRIWDVT